MLSRPPIPYEQLGAQFWARVKALHSESEFFKNNPRGDGK